MIFKFTNSLSSSFYQNDKISEDSLLNGRARREMNNLSRNKILHTAKIVTKDYEAEFQNFLLAMVIPRPPSTVHIIDVLVCWRSCLGYQVEASRDYNKLTVKY